MKLETETVRFTDKNGREWTPEVLAIETSWNGDRWAVVSFPLRDGVSCHVGKVCRLMRHGMPLTGLALKSDAPAWRFYGKRTFVVRRSASAARLVHLFAKQRPAVARAERWMRENRAVPVANVVAPDLKLVIGKVPDRLLRYEAVHGDFGECVGPCACQVEPDGVCANGWPSWLRAVGMI